MRKLNEAHLHAHQGQPFFVLSRLHRTVVVTFTLPGHTGLTALWSDFAQKFPFYLNSFFAVFRTSPEHRSRCTDFAHWTFDRISLSLL